MYTIKESLNQAYPITFDTKKGYIRYLFKTYNGRRGYVSFHRENDENREFDGYELFFDVNGSMGETGEGDAFRIFATVISAMLDFNSNYNPHNHPIVFEAGLSNKMIGDKFSTSRIDLYRAMLKRYSKRYDFSFFEDKKSWGSRFTIIDNSKKSISESLDQPYPWKLSSTVSYCDEYEFTTDDGRKCKVEFITTSHPEAWEIYLDVDKEMNKITGKGDAFRIMATVISIMTDFSQHRIIDHLTITARKKSRIDLYRTILKKFAKQENYTFSELGYDTRMVFTVRQKEHPASLKESFDKPYPTQLSDAHSDSLGAHTYTFRTTNGKLGEISFYTYNENKECELYFDIDRLMRYHR